MIYKAPHYTHSKTLSTSAFKSKKVRFMVLNTTFNNMSAILWCLVLLVKETKVPGENHWPAVIHRQTSSDNVLSSTLRHSGFQTQNASGNRYWLHN